MIRKLQLENLERKTKKPTPIKTDKTWNGLYPVATVDDEIKRKRIHWRSRRIWEAAKILHKRTECEDRDHTGHNGRWEWGAFCEYCNEPLSARNFFCPAKKLRKT